MTVFWGEGGQYGPYILQADGWPNAGQVMRDFRQQMGLSAEDAAKLYTDIIQKQTSREEGKKPVKTITASWILNMENENKVPATIGRRRILADMFQIPYGLFGLAPLCQIELRPTSSDHLGNSILVQSAIEDIQRYEREINYFWQLHYTNTASNLLADINLSLGVLEAAQELCKGNLKEHIQSLLNSYYVLGARITRDTNDLKKSLFYADNAIRVAKVMRQDYLVAYSLYARGYSHLIGGLYEDKAKDGTFKTNEQKILSAIHDFEQALPSARPQIKGFLWLELSRAYVHLQRSQSDITIGLEYAKKAKDSIDVWDIDHRHTSITGLQKGLNEGMFKLGNAITLTAVGRSERALEELDFLAQLKGTKGIAKNQVRQQTWIDIVYAQAALSSKNYYEAVMRLTNACVISSELHMYANMKIIDRTYHKLLTTPYKNNTDVIDLKHMIDGHNQMRKGIE